MIDPKAAEVGAFQLPRFPYRERIQLPLHLK